MSHQYLAVAAILKNTIASINEILKEPADELHRIRITNDLQLQHDRLLLITGSGDLETGQSAVLGPATTIGGKAIKKQRKFTADDMIPSDDKVHNLRKQVDAAVDYFAPEANAEGILANIPELLIRGVAKKAGLKVTKDEPKDITVEFIEKIKEALAAAGLNEHIDDDDDEEEVNATGLTMGTGTVMAPEIQHQIVNETQPAQGVEELKVEQPNNDASVGKSTEEPKPETKPDPKKKTGK